MKKVVMPILLIVIMLIGGCTNKETSGVDEKWDKSSSYPIKTKEVLTYWVALNANIASIYENFGQTPFAKELTKRTGIEIKYIHPAAGQENQALSLLIASDELPDMMEYNWLYSFGGPTKSLQDGTILPLTKVIKEHAPNLSNYLAQNEDIAKSLRTDGSEYYVFPFIRGDKELLPGNGPIYRSDWLKDLGLDVPVTYDDLKSVLIAFKEKKGATAPLSATNSSDLISMVGGKNNFYLVNGEVKFGPLEPDYKRALIRLNDLYSKGLLDENFVSVEKKILDGNMLNDKTGATIGAGGSNLGFWLDTAAKGNKSFDLAGGSFPVEKNGDIPFCKLSQKYPGYGSVAISTRSKNIELSAKFLDYSYSEEGKMLNNFGIEGLSYTMINGEPTYTDEILKNPEGLIVAQAMGKYFRASNSGPFVQSKRYLEQYYNHTQQKEALRVWGVGMDEGLASMLPPITYSAEENAEYADISNEVYS